MHLLNLTLQPPTSITTAIIGGFSGTPKQQEIAACRGGSRIDIMKLDENTQTLETLYSCEAFSGIRSMQPFRLTGQGKDYLIIGSDSGNLAIVEFHLTPTPRFEVLHKEPFGKSGARRTVPGQWLGIDPRGRSLMIGALEKSKLVYVLNRNAEGKLFPSSPLEAHKQNAIISALIGVDVGFDNPMYACLETSYEEADADWTGEAFERAEKMLTFYELDLGLNHVVRKWSEATDPRANMLVQVPGGQNATTDKFDGPSGVLVCCEDHIIWKNIDTPAHRIPIPRRRNPLAPADAEPRGVIIVSAVMHKIKGAFFFLLQSEDGDLFKVTMEHTDEEVHSVKIKYFDTIPVATSLCILKSGYLFCASEFGNHHLYHFQGLGDNEDDMEWSSANYPDNGMTEEPLPFAYCSPRPLENLILTESIDSLNPVVDAKTFNLLGVASDTPQIFAACGRGARSTFRTLRHGLDVQELVNSPLPGTPNAVWTLKVNEEDEYDTYIVLSFVNGTLVLTIGETIEEVHDTGFLSSGPTIAVQQLGQYGLVQIHPHGLRHVMPNKQVNEWHCPGGKTIISATTNKRQVVLALNSSELVYFEVDDSEGALSEYEDLKSLPANATCLSVADVPEGRQRTPYLAVGCENQTVHIISLEPDNCFTTLSLQALTAPPTSICLAEMFDTTFDKNRPTLFLNIGLQTGVLLRTVVDAVNGELTDTRQRFLGSQPAKLVRTSVHGSPAVMALSSRSWLNYTYQDRLEFVPLIYDTLEHASSFSAELCPDGLIGITGNTLRIFNLPKLGLKLKQDIIPLSYTPRRFAPHPHLPVMYVVESDHRAYGQAAIDRVVSEKKSLGKKVDMSVLDLPPAEFGRPKAEAGQWASLIRVIDPLQAESLQTIDLDENEAAFSVAVVPFASRGGESLLVVGTAVDVTIAPRTCSKGYLRLYQISEDGRSLSLLNVTPTDEVPMSLAAFQGQLLAGVGKALRLYELGKKQLLRKCENNSFPTAIVSLNVQGSRIIAGDIQESTFYVAYKSIPTRQLLIFADDTQPRWLTAVTMVDYETVACGDKFGNVFLNRLPDQVSSSVDDDPSGAGILHERSYLMGAAHKTHMLMHYHVGSIVTSITKVALVAGGRDVLLYTTVNGAVGALLPFQTKDDIEFMTTLEMHMRSQPVFLTGRDHIAYRGYYAPVKSVVDGDLCESFASLPYAQQQSIASELDRTVAEVLKKVESYRTSSAF